MRTRTSVLWLLVTLVGLPAAIAAPVQKRALRQTHQLKALQIPQRAFDNDQESPVYTVNGELVNYDLSAYYVVDETGNTGYDFGYFQPACFTDDGQVWFRSLLPRVSPGDSWVGGTINGESITFSLPQLTDIGDDGRRYYMGAWVQNALTGQWEMLDGMTFTLAADRSRFASVDYGQIMLVGYDDQGNVWEVDYGLEGIRFDDTVAQPPADATVQAYRLKYYQADSKTPDEAIQRVAFSGDDVYLKGLCWLMPDVWVRGHLEGQTVSVPSGQYVGNNGNYITRMFFAQEDDDVLFPTSELTFTISDDRRSLRTSRYDYQRMGYSEQYIESTTYNASYTWFDLHPATPATPVINNYADGWLEYGIEPFDTDGNDLDPSLLQWRLYVNGQPFTFTPAQYPSLTEATQDISYGYSDFVDFRIAYDGYAVHINADNVWKVGLQAVYTVDGDTRTSGIVELQVGDEPVGPLFACSFDTFDDIGQFTVIDANEDGTTWTTSTFIGYEQMAMVRYHKEHAMDDWLITPAVRLEAGRSYKFSFTACCDYPNFPERLEAFYGTEATINGQALRLLDPTDITWDGTARRTLSAIATPAASGEYCFSIHGISDAYMFDLYVDDILIEAYSDDVPAPVSNLAASTAERGKTPVILTFETPTQTVSGKALTQITRIIISRGGERIGTIEQPAPGQQLSYSDADAQDGVQTYVVQAENANGLSIEQTVSIYVGDDFEPEAVGNLMAEETSIPGRVHVTWTAPSERGLNGGYIDPAAVRYSVWRVQDDTYHPIATGITECELYDDVEMTAQQVALGYYIRCYTSDPLSYSPNRTRIIIGTAYTLPFADSAPGGTRQHLWVDEDYSPYARWYGMATGDEDEVTAQDADGGLFVFFPMEPDDYASMVSGFVSLADTEWPQLVFHYYAKQGDNTLDVDVLDMDSPVTERVYSVSMADVTAEGWQKVTVPLTVFSGKGRVRVAFRAVSPTGSEDTYIDNIMLREAPAHNLSAGILTGPCDISVGLPATFSVTVSNTGRFEATNFAVELLRNGVVCDRQEMGYLAAGDVAVVTLSDRLMPFDSQFSALEYQARISYDDDDDPTDNQSPSLTIVVDAHLDLPAPTSLALSDGQLTWQPPMPYEQTTEGFEPYEAFTTTDLSPWRLWNGNPSYTVTATGMQGLSPYPHAGDPMAWQVFSPDKTGINRCDITTHTGDQVLAAFAAAEGQNDGWLISPRLATGEQSVSLYARAANADFPETLQVLWSDTDQQVSSFALLQSHTLDRDEWEPVSFSLPAGTRYFALRCTSHDCYALLVDDIAYRSSAADAQLTGYRLYQDGQLVADLDVNVLSYASDADARGYQLTAVYDLGESRPISIGDTNSIYGPSFVPLYNSGPFDVYTTSGQLVRRAVTTTDGLSPGVYIAGGRKLVVR